MPDPLRELHRGEDTLWHGRHTFTPGSAYGIFAESGRGKTTALSLISGIRKDYSGELIIKGKNTRKWSGSKWTNWRAESISVVPQGLRLFKDLTALENIEFVSSRFKNTADKSQVKRWILYFIKKPRFYPLVNDSDSPLFGQYVNLTNGFFWMSRLAI